MPVEQPVAKAPRRSAKLELALDIASDPQRAKEALAHLQREKFSRTCESARENWWRTWKLFHDAVAPSVDVLPLTPSKIDSVCSLFKAAGYKSVQN